MVKKTNQSLKRYKNVNGNIKIKNLDTFHKELYAVERQFAVGVANLLIKRTNGARAGTRTSAIPPLGFWRQIKSKKKENSDTQLSRPIVDFTSNRKDLSIITVEFGQICNGELLVGLICKNFIDKSPEDYYIVTLSKNPYNFSVWCRLCDDEFVNENSNYRELFLYVNLEKRKVSKNTFYRLLDRCVVPEEYKQEYDDTCGDLLDHITRSVGGIMEDIFRYEIPSTMFELYEWDKIYI
jgi:hypothetical protein